MSRVLSKRDYLTEHEEYLVRKSLGVDRDSIFVRIALETGARQSEIRRMKRADINLEDSTVYIHASKGSNDREIPIPRELCEKLVNVIKLGEEMPFDFCKQRAHQIWHNIRPKEVSKKFHSLRHTFAVRLYEDTKDILQVKEALGHRQISSTLVYARLVDGEKKLRDAANKRAQKWNKLLQQDIA